MTKDDDKILSECIDLFIHRTNRKYVGISITISDFDPDLYEVVFRFKEVSNDS